MFIIGRLMGVSTVLLTTGTSGRDDLFKKFTEMLQGSNLPSPWAQGYVHPDIEFAYGVGQNTAIPQLVRAPSNLPTHHARAAFGHRRHFVEAGLGE